MGIFSDIFNFFKDLFTGIFNFLKKYLLVIIIAIVAIYLMNPALFAAIVDWLAATAATIGAWVASGATALWGWLGTLSLTELLVGAAALWIIEDPSGFVDFVADAVESVVAAVAGGIAEGLGIGNIGLILGGGFLLYMFMKGKQKKESRVIIDPETGTPARPGDAILSGGS